jgi:hypothetical protein
MIAIAEYHGVHVGKDTRCHKSRETSASSAKLEDTPHSTIAEKTMRVKRSDMGKRFFAGPDSWTEQT